MPFNHSFVLKAGDPKRDENNPDKLGTVNVVQADGVFIDDLFDFFARYEQKVHSDEFICNAMKIKRSKESGVVLSSNFSCRNSCSRCFFTDFSCQNSHALQA